MLVYWIKENLNITVINTKNTIRHGGSMVLIHNQLRVLWCDNISVTVTLTPETARLHCDSLADYVTVIEYHTLYLHRHVRLVVSFSIFFDNHTHTHTHTHVSMADTRLPRPTMDWSASDCAQASVSYTHLTLPTIVGV